MNRIIARGTALALAAAASAYVFLMAVGPALAAARSDPLAGRRVPLGKPLFSFGTEVIIALVGTALILGIAILFTPREPPAWQKAERESRLARFDDELDDWLDETHDEEQDEERDGGDWRRAA